MSEQMSVFANKRLSCVEHVWMLGPTQEVHSVESRVAIDKIDCVRKSMWAFRKWARKIRIDALTEVAKLRWISRFGWMSFATFDGETCRALAGIETSERDDILIKQSTMRASYSKVAETSMPNIS
jgi:hypothetical protein